MRTSVWAIVAAATVGVHAQTPREMQVVRRAADAFGGADRIPALKTLSIDGHGQIGAQNGGGNITPSPDAPQKWVNINDFSRIVDLPHGRTRVRQRRINDFVFARSPNMLARNPRSNEGLDGDLAFDVAPDGKAARLSDAVARTRRMEMLAHPHRLLVQADMFSHEWDLMWWGQSYRETIKRWNLQVDRDVPIHGKILTFAEVLAAIDQQVKNAEDLCKAAAAAGFGLQGCPPKF